MIFIGKDYLSEKDKAQVADDWGIIIFKSSLSHIKYENGEARLYYNGNRYIQLDISFEQLKELL